MGKVSREKAAKLEAAKKEQRKEPAKSSDSSANVDQEAEDLQKQYSILANTLSVEVDGLVSGSSGMSASSKMHLIEEKARGLGIVLQIPKKKQQ